MRHHHQLLRWPASCVLFVALFACSSGQCIGLQGVCVWCMKPLPARVRAPGAPPQAAARVVVTTIAIRSTGAYVARCTLVSSFTENFSTKPLNLDNG